MWQLFPLKLEQESGMYRGGVGMHHLVLHKCREEVRRRENKIPSGGLSSVPGHACGLVGNLAKSISMSADINKKPSFNQIMQYGYAFDVSIDIANDQRGPLGWAETSSSMA